LWGFTKAVPNGAPGSFTGRQPGRASEETILLWIKGEIRFTDLDERSPLMLTAPVLERLALIEPLQQVTHRVTSGQQGMKIVLTQPLVFEAIHGLIQQTMQRQLYGVLGVGVLGDIQSLALICD
jgi:hypothetical protein